jgi:chemotaxis receptor (MCP) glutamine deamidase CheD
MSDEVRIYIGGVHASDRPVVIKTLLGSCISVCLYDPAARVGGMNHFMLPRGDGPGDDALRFGVHAMDCLIGAIMKLGGDRRRLVAKVFGGARVLAMKGPLCDVPQRNIDFVSEFLETDGIPVLSADVGGSHARHVHFHTASGRAFVKRVLGTRALAIAEEETRVVIPPTYGDVTLFE